MPRNAQPLPAQREGTNIEDAQDDLSHEVGPPTFSLLVEC
jgi:hypothetical protein